MSIDRIAREMVDVEPSADLEARIRARVRAAQTERAPRDIAWWGWRVAMPVAAAAVVTIAIALRGPASEVEPAEISSAPIQTAQAPAPAAPVTADATPRSEKAIVRVVNRSRASQTQTAQLSAEELAWMERRMPALEPVTALQMDHLGANTIQPEPLAITPLIMPPVTTEGSGTGRNDR